MHIFTKFPCAFHPVSSVVPCSDGCSACGFSWVTNLTSKCSGLYPEQGFQWVGRIQSCVCELEPQKTMNAEAPGVNCKWVLKNWHSHLGSTSHPSQTNEAPSASKWDWSPFETRHRTLGFWILRKVPLSMETRHKPALPPIPSSSGVM